MAENPFVYGEIVPACQQTCPTDTIIFGNLKDPSSRVYRAAQSGRAYRVLEQLNTQSAITYLRQTDGGESVCGGCTAGFCPCPQACMRPEPKLPFGIQGPYSRAARVSWAKYAAVTVLAALALAVSLFWRV